MAEIGLVAGVIGVAGAGAKLAITFYQIADALGSADREFRVIAAEVSAFSQVLGSVSKSLEGDIRAAVQSRPIAKTILVLCQNLLCDLTQLLEPLRLLIASKQRRRHIPIASRIKWILIKSKVALHRSSLESLKTSLTLLVATVDYAEVSQSNAPAMISDAYKAQVESVLHSSDQAVQTFISSTHLSTPALLFETESDDAFGSTNVVETADDVVPTWADPYGAETSLTDLAAARPQEVVLEHEGTPTPVHDDAKPHRPLSSPKDELQALSPSQVSKSGPVLLAYATSHVRTQELVRDLAKAVIRVNENEAGWGWRSHARSTDRRDRDLPPISASREDPARNDTYIPVHGPDQDQGQVNTSSKESSTPQPDLNEINEKLATLERILRQGKSTPIGHATNTGCSTKSTVP